MTNARIGLWSLVAIVAIISLVAIYLVGTNNYVRPPENNDGLNFTPDSGDSFPNNCPHDDCKG